MGDFPIAPQAPFGRKKTIIAGKNLEDNEMKRFKVIGLMVMLLAAVMLLGGCHAIKVSSDVIEVPSSLDETQTIELTFWAKNDSNKTQIEVYTRAIEEFEALYPNIRIYLKSYTKYDDIYADVIKSAQTGDQANICVTYPDHIATYMDSPSKPVLRLDNWMNDSRYGFGGSELRFDSPKESELVPEFLGECVLDGHYYAVPFMRSTEALYINQDMVEKLGFEVPDVVTWDFIWEVSEKAMEKDGKIFTVNGQDKLIPVIYKSTDNMMITMLKQLGAPYSTDSGEVLIFNDTTKSILQDIFSHSKKRQFSTFTRDSYPGNFLNREQCIFAIDSTAGATWMGGDAPLQDIPEEEQVSFRVAVRPVPQIDADNIRMISQGPSLCIFTKEDPQEVLASWLFVQYLLSDNVQMSYAETEGYLPVTLKAQQNAAYQDYLSRKGEDNNLHYSVKIEASELLMNHMSDTFVTPVFNGSTSLRSAAGQLIEEAVNKGYRSKANTLSNEEIEALFRRVNELYRLDEIKVKTKPAEETEEKQETEPAPTDEPEEEGNAEGGAQSLTNKFGMGAKLNEIKEQSKETGKTEETEKKESSTPSFPGKISLSGKLNEIKESANGPDPAEETREDTEIPEDTEDTEDVAVTSAKDIADGEFPVESKALLIGLPAVWAVLGATALAEKGKARRKKKAKGNH